MLLLLNSLNKPISSECSWYEMVFMDDAEKERLEHQEAVTDLLTIGQDHGYPWKPTRDSLRFRYLKFHHPIASHVLSCSPAGQANTVEVYKTHPLSKAALKVIGFSNPTLTRWLQPALICISGRQNGMFFFLLADRFIIHEVHRWEPPSPLFLRYF